MPMGTLRKPAEILLVEDNPGDARLAVEAFREGRVANRLHAVEDVEQALDFLRGRNAGAPRPDLILLDLRLPRGDGRELLAELKQDPDLRRIPVIVLTTSQSEQDVLASYDLHVNCYITKPVDLDQFYAVVRAIEDFWLTIVTLPPK